MFETPATELCSGLEYNIIGIDPKNEPVDGGWREDDTDYYCDATRTPTRRASRMITT
jgi:hypothetical protein